MTLNGKTALVTGARRGMGHAIVERVRMRGRHAADVRPLGSSAAATDAGRFLTMDVTSPEQVTETMDTILREEGKLDILVNTAAVESTIEDTTLAKWNRSFAINVTGAFLTCKHALTLLRPSGKPTVSRPRSSTSDPTTATSPTLGRRRTAPPREPSTPSPGRWPATTARGHPSQRGVPRLHRHHPCCRASSTVPAPAPTAATSTSYRRRVRDVHPIHRDGTPDDTANLVHWLAPDEARYASGQLWVLDVGPTAQVQQMRS